MRIIVTAGPTREYIDDVRFITNASSGRMGCAVAAAAGAAGHEVTLLAGPGVAEKRGQATFSAGGAAETGDSHLRGCAASEPVPVSVPVPDSEPVPVCEIVRFVSVDDLRDALSRRFASCDALVMTAAVGDFRPQQRAAGKIPRAGGAVTVTLVPTEDVLAAVAACKRAGQIVVAFAVESLPPAEAQAKARGEMQRKGADLVVVNGPEAMSAERSLACVLDAAGVVLDWESRSKAELARLLVELIAERVG
jgi:phosphopantothenoylcysteine decarboxylase/phosphopantothenate--cysteine ligase